MKSSNIHLKALLYQIRVSSAGKMSGASFPAKNRRRALKCLLALLMLHLLLFQCLRAGNVHAQEGNEVRVSLSLHNESLKTAFEKIEKQAKVRFAYIRREVEKYRNITLSVSDLPLAEVMERLLQHTLLSFRLVNDKVIVFHSGNGHNSPSDDVLPVMGILADGTLKGKIVDDKGEAVPAASVSLGYGIGAAASANGEFTITGISPGTYTLRVSAVGFTTYVSEIIIADGQVLELTIDLAAGNNAMNEVIVTGYSRQSKRDVTGAVSTISSDVIAQQPVTDLTAILQGRVSGVTIDGQGGPGVEQVVRIRGIGTIGDNNPLYVIDGVQTKSGLNMINTNDIESITVLKDAASSALYGARGSNGVIVITTKRGKKGAPRLEYNSYVGAEIPGKLPAMLTPQQYADAFWKNLESSGQPLNSVIYGNGAQPALPDYLIGRKTSPTFIGVAEGNPAADPALYNLSSYRIMKANKEGTDWFDVVFDPALTHSHQLALSGATDKSNYAVTLNYLDNNGILRNTYFKRYSLRANTEFSVTPWLRAGENFQFAYTNGNTINNHTDQNVIANLYNTSPLMPVYDIAGNLSGANGAPPEFGDNPYNARRTDKGANGYSARVMGSVYVEAEPVKNLVFQTKASIDYLPFQSRFFQDTAPQLRFPITSFRFSEFAGHTMEWRTTQKLSYSTVFNGIHKVDAFIAYEAAENRYRGFGAASDSIFYPLPGFQVVSTNTGVNWQVSGNQNRFTYISQIGNLNYSLDDKYLASFTIRRDGTSRFTELRRYGIFPSVSAGWRISEEKFMDRVEWIDDLKLRASLGTAGNDNIGTGLTSSHYYTDPMYTYYDLAGLNNAAQLGFALTQIGNPLLQWEVNQTTNLGFDAALFNNRVTLGFNWFNRKTDKLLYNPPVTGLQGDAAAPMQNIMNFTNKGIELELGYYSSRDRALSYEMNANISTYRNNVTYIDGRPETFLSGDSYARSIQLSRSMVGLPVSSFYGYIYDGIVQEGDNAGHFRFMDISGPDNKPDGIVDDRDRTFIGNPHPKLSYGYNLNLFYKNFDLNVFFQGVYGNKLFNYWRAFSVWPGNYGAGSDDTWSEDNRDAKLPVYSLDDLDDDRPSTFFIENGSYLRLKNLQLGYTFNNIGGVNKLRVYLQGYNLLTFTNYTGTDPEVSSGAPGSIGIDYGGRYPIARKVLFGVNLTL